MVICLERGADLHMAQLMPLPLSVCCSSKIQIGFTFLVLAHLGSPGKRAVKRVCREEMQAGIRRRYEIATHRVDVWHVLEYDHYKLAEPSHGQFHAGDTYVIRWNYSTLQTGQSVPAWTEFLVRLAVVEAV